MAISQPLPPLDELAPNGATVHIEWSDAVVNISVIYPQSMRRRDLRNLVLLCPIALLLPLAVWVIYRNRQGVGFDTMVAAALTVVLLVIAIPQIIKSSRSYLFTADLTGLVVETIAGNHHRQQYVSIDELSDVMLGIRKRPSRYRVSYVYWLWIKRSGYRPDIQCLETLGYDHIVMIAQNLRKALGMPECSWPPKPRLRF